MHKTTMRLLVFSFFILLMQQLSAQSHKDVQYAYEDASTGTVYQVKIEHDGQDVQVFMKNMTEEDWTKCEVLYHDDGFMKIRLPESGYTYYLKENPDKILLIAASNSSEYEYHKVE